MQQYKLPYEYRRGSAQRHFPPTVYSKWLFEWHHFYGLFYRLGLNTTREQHGKSLKVFFWMNKILFYIYLMNIPPHGNLL
jgi:hypothetical protein